MVIKTEINIKNFETAFKTKIKDALNEIYMIFNEIGSNSGNLTIEDIKIEYMYNPGPTPYKFSLLINYYDHQKTTEQILCLVKKLSKCNISWQNNSNGNWIMKYIIQ